MNNYLSGKKVVLFGAGIQGKMMLEMLIEDGIIPECFLDNNPATRSIKYESRGIEYEIPVRIPNTLLQKDKAELKIIITPNEPYRSEIERQLNNMGFGECVCQEFDLIPFFVRIEASTLCQLNCKLCYMRRNNSVAVGAGYLKSSDFKDFINKHPYIKNVELSNSGEIFLNPELLSIIEYAFERNVKLYANGGVNFNTVSDEVLEGLVKYKFSSMCIAIDGACQETYSIYRRNGDFNIVIENIKKLNAMKRKYNSEFPRLIWQYIIMEHNEEDAARAKELAKSLNMEIKFALTWDTNYTPKNREMLKSVTGLEFLTRGEYLLANPEYATFSSPCRQLWSSPQINWDGRLLGCCVVYQGDFGVNVFEVGLEKAMNSENYKYAQSALRGKSPGIKNKENIPCFSCSIYKEMVKKNCFLEL